MKQAENQPKNGKIIDNCRIHPGAWKYGLRPVDTTILTATTAAATQSVPRR
jgi:hypothetical protein